MFARSSRLALERLDDRTAPSSVVGNDVATSDWMPNPTTPIVWGILPDGGGLSPQGESSANQKPVIVNFRVVITAGSEATYSGTVQDENPAGLAVRLTGAQGCLGSGKTVITDANGNFTFKGAVRVMVDTGWAYADVSDAQGVPADEKDCWVDLG